MIPRGPSDSRLRRGEASARSEGVGGVDWGGVGGILTDEATYGITLFLVASRIHSGARKTERSRHHQNASVITNHSGRRWRHTEPWGGGGGGTNSVHIVKKKTKKTSQSSSQTTHQKRTRLQRDTNNQ